MSENTKDVTPIAPICPVPAVYRSIYIELYIYLKKTSSIV